MMDQVKGAPRKVLTVRPKIKTLGEHRASFDAVHASRKSTESDEDSVVNCMHAMIRSYRDHQYVTSTMISEDLKRFVFPHIKDVCDLTNYKTMVMRALGYDTIGDANKESVQVIGEPRRYLNKNFGKNFDIKDLKIPKDSDNEFLVFLREKLNDKRLLTIDVTSRVEPRSVLFYLDLALAPEGVSPNKLRTARNMIRQRSLKTIGSGHMSHLSMSLLGLEKGFTYFEKHPEEMTRRLEKNKDFIQGIRDAIASKYPEALKPLENEE